MRRSLPLLLLSLAFHGSTVSADPLAPPAIQAPSQIASSWMPVKLQAAQSLTLPKNHPQLKALAARTQRDLEAIDRTMTQIGELLATKQPNKDVARRILGQLKQYRRQLQQTEKELADMGNSRSDGTSDADRKRAEMAQALFDDQTEEAKKSYDAAKEQFKKALKILEEHVERETQVVQKISS